MVILGAKLVASQNQAQWTFEVSQSTYVCRLVIQNIESEENLRNVAGVHVETYSDADVAMLSQSNSIVNVFSSLLIDRLSNTYTPRSSAQCSDETIC